MRDQDQRRHMIENQLRPSNVTDVHVLAAMEAVPREAFVPPALRGVAYGDDDLLLPDGRFLIEPLVLARLLEMAEPDLSGSMLVVGCDTGYSAVVGAKLAETVFALIDKAFESEVTHRIETVEADNVLVSATSSPLDGLPENAPYDIVLAIGQLNEVPESLLKQLRPGGRFVAVVEDRGVGRGTMVTEIHGHFAKKIAFDAAIPRFKKTGQAPAFSF